jgi:hypothetical protein
MKLYIQIHFPYVKKIYVEDTNRFVIPNKTSYFGDFFFLNKWYITINSKDFYNLLGFKSKKDYNQICLKKLNNLTINKSIIIEICVNYKFNEEITDRILQQIIDNENITDFISRIINSKFVNLFPIEIDRILEQIYVKNEIRDNVGEDYILDLE